MEDLPKGYFNTFRNVCEVWREVTCETSKSFLPLITPEAHNKRFPCQPFDEFIWRISWGRLADYVKEMCLSACHTYSTIIFPCSANHTTVFWRCRNRLLLKLPTVPCWRTPTISYDFRFQKLKCHRRYLWISEVDFINVFDPDLDIRSNFRLRRSDNLHTDSRQHSWMSLSKNKATQIYATSRSHISSGYTQRKHPQNER